jgi:hypothetical protein
MKHYLTRADLNAAGCDNPNCHSDHSVLFLHSNCHPEAGTWASYDKSTGVLTIECVECQEPVASILVAASAYGTA